MLIKYHRSVISPLPNKVIRRFKILVYDFGFYFRLLGFYNMSCDVLYLQAKFVEGEVEKVFDAG